MSLTGSVPLCSLCRGSVHAAGEPDFEWHAAEEHGEACGAADHGEIAGIVDALDDVEYGDLGDEDFDGPEFTRDTEADHGYAPEYMNRSDGEPVLAPYETDDEEEEEG